MELQKCLAVSHSRHCAPPDAVEEFVPLPGVGHCPQDEDPEEVNPLILAFVRRHAAGQQA